MAEYDIVLFGATSFVGKILSRYLLEHCPVGGDVSWAIAARSRSKLEALRESLGEKARGVPQIVVDASDEAGLKAMCEASKVIISTVGPYALYGEALVKACASSGTDYCDLTGEPQWIAKMLRRYEEVAKISGARIVHSCGFDSIPSDLGVYFLQQQAQERFGDTCRQVKMRVKAMKGGASGGTIASMTNLMKEVSRDPQLRKLLVNPYALCPDGHGYSVRQSNLKAAKFDEDFHAWIAPFVMAAINTRIVHRSNALMEDYYGKDFRYDEAMMTGKNTMGGLNATLMSMGLGGFMFAAVLPPTRWLMEKTFLPKPGEGPSEQAQRDGFYDLRFIGKCEDGRSIRAKVTGDRDPGYGSTAKMLGQAALCLVQDLDKDTVKGGFWTPASAMGDALIARLKSHAGLTFELLEGE